MTVASYKVAGRYELGSSLGAGGMAQVFRAHDELLDRDVAVKLFNASSDPRGPDRVRVEMRTLAGLSHPALVTVYDAGTDVPPSGPPRAFLVMALVEGPSLSQLLLNGPLPVEAVRGIGLRVGEALEFVHSRGIVHRDVKPANVLIEQDGLAYLADFGIARGVEQVNPHDDWADPGHRRLPQPRASQRTPRHERFGCLRVGSGAARGAHWPPRVPGQQHRGRARPLVANCHHR